MSMPRILVCFLSFALTCLTSGSQRALPKIERVLPGTLENRLEQYFSTGIHKFGNSRAEIIKNLGKPKLERTNTDLRKANKLSAIDERLIRGNGTRVENEIIELAYDGLLLRILKVNSPPHREIIYCIKVTGDRYKMLWNLNVGSPRQEVYRILGDPYRSRLDALEDSYSGAYSGDPTAYTGSVIFAYHGDLVSQISFWLDLN